MHNLSPRFPGGSASETATELGPVVLCPPCTTSQQLSAAATSGHQPAPSGGVAKKYRLCTECGKSVQNLAKHLKMHRGVKPDRLQCHVCEKTLCSANALKVHVERKVDGVFLFLFALNAK